MKKKYPIINKLIYSVRLNIIWSTKIFKDKIKHLKKEGIRHEGDKRYGKRIETNITTIF